MIGLDYGSVWGRRGGEEVRKERMKSKKKKEEEEEKMCQSGHLGCFS